MGALSAWADAPRPAAFRPVSLRDWVPRWWAGEGGAVGRVLDVALLPAEGAFRGIAAARNRLYDGRVFRIESVLVPVVSVGNLAVGGAGKTPFSAWLVRRLLEWGRRPAVAMRGYGEDEVLLHHELNPSVPVFAAARRVDAAQEAVDAGCDVVVLDDAFQHRALARDLDIVLVSAEGWTARRRLMPRGPWREAVGALRRAGVAVVTRKSASAARSAEVAAELRRLVRATPVVECSLTPSALRRLAVDGDRMEDDVRRLDWLDGRRILAVAALADPRPFFAHLREHAADVESVARPDHHAFTADEAAALAARADGRVMVMTHKDAVKLRPLLSADVDAHVLEQRVEITAGGEILDAALRRALRETTR